MRGRGLLVIGMVVLWSTLPASAALAAHGGTWHVVERVSVASDGSQANGGSYDAAVNGDGRVVAFSSGADNLVSGDGNGRQDVFVHDRATGRTRRVSVASDGSQANGGSHDAAVSGDGRVVAFFSGADNLVTGDSNDTADMFVHDRATGRTRRVSVASDGSQANGYSYGAAVSGDGRVVAFWSEADNLVTGDSNDTADMFVHDRATGRTERVSFASDGQVNDSSFWPAVSGDGRIVVFDSFARNLVPGDSNNAFDVFVAERAASGPVCTVTGSAGDDVLIGTAGDDVLCGRGGDDRLLGRGGDDLLRGGRGGDRLRGGWGADRLGGRRGPDRLYGGYGPDRLYGGYGDDVLRGGPGPDRLRGGPGDDLLFGGPGDDWLRGNRGVDLVPERHD